jgi:transcriptional regulator with XRE-family HTH domain
MTHKPKGRKVSNYDPFNIILGRKLGQIRKFLNLTQTDLGKCIDVSHQQYQKYETGYNKLSAAMLWKIKEYQM